ncbi:hypothetical protein SRIMM317S_05866 [Streptomyces rimosus subsp. rimosus]
MSHRYVSKSHRHVNKRTGVLVGGAATALLAAAIVLPQANASPEQPAVTAHLLLRVGRTGRVVAEDGPRR